MGREKLFLAVVVGYVAGLIKKKFGDGKDEIDSGFVHFRKYHLTGHWSFSYCGAWILV